jgi:hypothetical protein
MFEEENRLRAKWESVSREYSARETSSYSPDISSPIFTTMASLDDADLGVNFTA